MRPGVGDECLADRVFGVEALVDVSGEDETRLMLLDDVGECFAADVPLAPFFADVVQGGAVGRGVAEEDCAAPINGLEFFGLRPLFERRVAFFEAAAAEAEERPAVDGDELLVEEGDAGELVACFAEWLFAFVVAVQHEDGDVEEVHPAEQRLGFVFEDGEVAAADDEVGFLLLYCVFYLAERFGVAVEVGEGVDSHPLGVLLMNFKSCVWRGGVFARVEGGDGGFRAFCARFFDSLRVCTVFPTPK